MKESLSNASIGSVQYIFLNTLWLTYNAKNSLSMAKLHHSVVSRSLNWWPKDGTYVNSIFQKNAKETTPVIEQTLDNVREAERDYRINKSNLERLKKYHPTLAKKYAVLEKRLHL